MKEYRFVIIVALITLIGIPLYFFMDLNAYLYKSINPIDSTRTIITVAPGEKFSNIVDKLYSHHLISYPIKFKLAARMKGYDQKFIAGEYSFSGSMSPIRILESLKRGNIFLHRLTIPEGFTIKQVADKIESAGLSTQEAFMTVAMNPELAAKMEIPAQTCEGYLFPDTYFFSKDTTPEQMIVSMVTHFREQFTLVWEEKANQLGFSIHEILTLASIIEKETGQDIERPIISSVFHNRLAKKMRLESDPTVIYGMSSFNGDITKKDLQESSPYNTYVILGLPPGPIANPGIKSIRAALFPAKTNYLFFVAKKDGTHEFSCTLAEHNNAVRKFQLSSPPPPPPPPIKTSDVTTPLPSTEISDVANIPSPAEASDAADSP